MGLFSKLKGNKEKDSRKNRGSNRIDTYICDIKGTRNSVERLYQSIRHLNNFSLMNPNSHPNNYLPNIIDKFDAYLSDNAVNEEDFACFYDGEDNYLLDSTNNSGSLTVFMSGVGRYSEVIDDEDAESENPTGSLFWQLICDILDVEISCYNENTNYDYKRQKDLSDSFSLIYDEWRNQE